MLAWLEFMEEVRSGRRKWASLGRVEEEKDRTGRSITNQPPPPLLTNDFSLSAHHLLLSLPPINKLEGGGGGEAKIIP